MNGAYITGGVVRMGNLFNINKSQVYHFIASTEKKAFNAMVNIK